jgi:thiol:disulfide interchange protein
MAEQRSQTPRSLLLLVVATAAIFYFWRPAQSQSQNAPDLVKWRTDLTAAKTEAGAANKRLLLFFTASWCPDCQWTKGHTFADSSIARRVNSEYVPVSIDEDVYPAIAKEFNIHEIPEFFLLDQKDGKILKEYRHGALNSDQFLAWLDE